MQLGNAAITIRVSGDITVRNCDIGNAYIGIYFYDINQGGLFANANPADNKPWVVVPLSGFGKTGNHLIEYNRVHHNSFGMFFESTWDLGSTLRYNLIYENHHKTDAMATQVKTLTSDGNNHSGGAIWFKDQMLSPVAIYNNTFWHNYLIFVGSWRPGSQMLIFNNIYAQPFMYWGAYTLFSANPLGIDKVFPFRMKNCVYAAQQQTPSQDLVKVENGFQLEATSGPIPAGTSITTPFPKDANIKWFETTFKSTDPLDPGFLVPNWGDTQVVRLIRNQGWSASGVKNPDGSIADLGAISFSGNRPNDVALIKPTAPVLISGTGAQTVATMTFNLYAQIGTLKNPTIKYFRFIKNILVQPNGWGDNVKAVPSTDIIDLPVPAAPVIIGGNTYTVSIPARLAGEDYAFVEVVVEGTGADGKTVSTSVGFLPFRRIDYKFIVEIWTLDGKTKLSEVHAGEAVKLRITAQKADGSAFFNQVDPVDVRLNSGFVLLVPTNPPVAITIPGGILGTIDKTVMFTKVPQGGIEYVMASGQWVSGSVVLPFLGTSNDIRILPGTAAKILFQDPPSNSIGANPPIIDPGTQYRATVQVFDAWDNKVAQPTQVSLSSLTPANGNILGGSKIITTDSSGRGPFLVQAGVSASENDLFTLQAVLVGSISDTDLANIKINNLRPQNPVSLVAEVVSSSRVQLNWTDPSADSVRVWYGTEGIPKSWDIPAATFHSVNQPLAARVDTIDALQSNTTYYFAIQVYQSGLWSSVTAASSDTAITPAITDTNHIVNTVDITELVFDTVTNEIRVRWQVDTTLGEQYVGIQYGIGSYSLSLPTAGLTVRTSAQGTMIIPLREPLRFDTTYYVSIWVQKVDGQWSLPTALSQDTVRVKSFKHQTLTFFNSAPARDTVRINSSRFIIWKDSLYTGSNLSDTVKWYASTSNPGFRAGSAAYLFQSRRTLSQNIFIGFKYDSSLINTNLIPSIRIYRDSMGVFLLVDSCSIDRANGIVYAKTRDLSLPFVALLDTVAPAVILYSSTAKVAIPGVAVSDTICLQDNIGNLRWWLYAATGGDPLKIIDQSVLGSTRDTIFTACSSSYISASNGLRMLLVVYDGVHYDTTNLSRTVQRTHSDPIVIPQALKWYPTYATASLSGKTLITALTKLFPLQAEQVYGKKYFRAMRWIGGAWTEYTAPREQQFAFEPGRLFWICTPDTCSFDLGRAVTLSLADTVSFSIPPRDWLDFGMPYKFNVYLKDVLAASGSAGDSLRFYRWVDSTIYTARWLHLPGTPGRTNWSAELDSVTLGGYSIYNPLSSTLTIKIPPTPTTRSSNRPVAKTSAVDNGWTVAITGVADGGKPINEVGCSFMVGKSAQRSFPAAPAFSDVQVRVLDSRNQSQGYLTIVEPADGGYTYRLSISNSGPSAAVVAIQAAAVTALPEGYKVRLYNPLKQAWITAHTLDTMAINPGNAHIQLLAVGTDEYFSDFMKTVSLTQIGILGVFPNPVQTMTKICYALPLGGASSYSFSLYSVAGKKIWGYSAAPMVSRGTATLNWNRHDNNGKKVASGIYYLEMRINQAAGQTVVNRRIISVLP